MAITKFEEIKTFDECFEIAGLPKASNLSEIPEEMETFLMSVYNQAVLVKAANKLRNPDLKIDWRDSEQHKYFPWFEMLSSGSVAFDGTSSASTVADSGYASRLAFLDGSDAKNAAEKFPEIFENVLIK